MKHYVKSSALADQFYNSVDEVIKFLVEHVQVKDTSDAGIASRLKGADVPLWRRHFIKVELKETAVLRRKTPDLSLGGTSKYHAFSFPLTYDMGAF